MQDDSIQFGTVGSTGITYKGTVAGNSMSGTYQLIDNGTTFSGPWTAAKTVSQGGAAGYLRAPTREMSLRVSEDWAGRGDGTFSGIVLIM